MKKNITFISDDLDKLLWYIFIGVIIGGRLGYIGLYNLDYFLQNPIEIVSIWKWGMSFHGWCAWVIIALWLFSFFKKYPFWELADHLAVIIPIALGLWRIGNYINNELPWYTPYNWPFAMNIDGKYYFPSPLLEMLLEWVILFFIMYYVWKILAKSWPNDTKYPWILSSLFLIWYSSARLISEQFRLPDGQIWYLWWTDWITLGIVYTVPMLLLGIWILIRQTQFYRK